MGLLRGLRVGRPWRRPKGLDWDPPPGRLTKAILGQPPRGDPVLAVFLGNGQTHQHCLPVSAVLVTRLLEQRVVRDGRPAGTWGQGGDQRTSPRLPPHAKIKGPVRVFDGRPVGTRGQGGDQRTSPHLPPHAKIKGPVRVRGRAVSRPRLAAVRRESR